MRETRSVGERLKSVEILPCDFQLYSRADPRLKGLEQGCVKSAGVRREENMHNDCVHIYKSGKEEISRSSQHHRFLLFASSESKAKTTMATGKTSRERSKAGVVLLQM
jgi:hypothetical protein